MNAPHITLTGNVAAPPVLRLAAGTPVTSFRVGATPRRHDKATDTWTDDETMWFTVTAWRGLAEHCVTSLMKGDKVVVSGRLTQRTWTPDDGAPRPGLEVDAASVGLELSRTSALSAKKQPLPRETDDAEAVEGGEGVVHLRGDQRYARDDRDDDGGGHWGSTGNVDLATGAVEIESLLPEQVEGEHEAIPV